MADSGDMLDGRIKGCKLRGVQIQVRMVKSLDHMLVDESLQGSQIESRSFRVFVERGRNIDLKAIIVPVSVGVVALAEHLLIALFIK